MPGAIPFHSCRGKKVLEIDAGSGTDLVQFATHGADVTDAGQSAEELAAAEESFKLRGLSGTFLRRSECLPAGDDTFDLVYTNGAVCRVENVTALVQEILRVLKPGGQVIVVAEGENSFDYWATLVFRRGLAGAQLAQSSIARMLSSSRQILRVYTPRRLHEAFSMFEDVRITRHAFGRYLVLWGRKKTLTQQSEE
jgi:ubiquinone/menaquinone biosynthesis C-methylase UbiE